MIGYILEGVEEEYIMVFKTNDLDDLLQVIEKLKRTRDKTLRGIAEELEQDYYRRTVEKATKKRYNR